MHNDISLSSYYRFMHTCHPASVLRSHYWTLVKTAWYYALCMFLNSNSGHLCALGRSHGVSSSAPQAGGAQASGGDGGVGAHEGPRVSNHQYVAFLQYSIAWLETVVIYRPGHSCIDQLVMGDMR